MRTFSVPLRGTGRGARDRKPGQERGDVNGWKVACASADLRIIHHVYVLVYAGRLGMLSSAIIAHALQARAGCWPILCGSVDGGAIRH